MKKVLILSYYFPPANFVAAERIHSWAKYLKSNGIYPIFITRNWNKEQSTTYEPIKENTYKHIQYEDYEVHYMPYFQNLRDRLFENKSNRIIQQLRKLLTFIELIGVCFSIHFFPYKNMYYKALEILKNNKDIEQLIISGSPFESFHFGYKIKKKHPSIQWIPDYRDEWTTFQDMQFDNFFFRTLYYLNRYFEKKWTSNAECFITVSNKLVDNIDRFILKKGYIVMNGYEAITIEPVQADFETFRLCYNGTLYPQQNFEILLNAYMRLINAYKDQIKIEFIFAGMDENSPKFVQIKNEMQGYGSYLTALPRMPKIELLALLSASDVMIMTNYGKGKGFYPVKMYDYYLVEKPILLCPSDNDSIEAFILETHSGFVADTEEACYPILEQLIKYKLNKIPYKHQVNKEKGNFYSRSYQAYILSEILKQKTDDKNSNH